MYRTPQPNEFVPGFQFEVYCYKAWIPVTFSGQFSTEVIENGTQPGQEIFRAKKLPLEEIAQLLSEIDQLPSGQRVQRLHGQSARKLVMIYNKHREFNRGKPESPQCPPCIERVLRFFQEYMATKTAT